MKILLYTHRDETTGWGHWFRIQALQYAAKSRGHLVYPVSNVLGKDAQIPDAIMPRLLSDQVWHSGPDFIIADVPWEEKYVYLLEQGVKVCAIGGIVHPSIDGRAFLTIGQSNVGQYCAPEYLILRKEIKDYKVNPESFWFVFGGAIDYLRLLSKFHNAMPGMSSILISTVLNKNLSPAAWLFSPEKDMFAFMSCAKKAVVHMGMVVWELIYYRVPTYVFSATDEHLKTALYLDEMGWVKAWPEVGLPDDARFCEFLNLDFSPTGPAIDAEGANRVICLLEENFG